MRAFCTAAKVLLIIAGLFYLVGAIRIGFAFVVLACAAILCASAAITKAEQAGERRFARRVVRNHRHRKAEEVRAILS